MKQIKLTQGKFAIVDDCEFEKASQLKWCAMKMKNTYYAGRHVPLENGKETTLYMHHFLFGKTLKGYMYDHKNGNGLDNQKDNIILVTNRQNMQNIHTVKSSKYPGVIWCGTNKKWRAMFYNKKNIHIGYFHTEDEAFIAYKNALKGIGETIHANYI